MCNSINHKPYGSGLTDVTEVCKHIVYILDNIFFQILMVIQYTTALGSMMQPPKTKSVSGMVTTSSHPETSGEASQ